jgi:hypothetical protein
VHTFAAERTAKLGVQAGLANQERETSMKTQTLMSICLALGLAVVPAYAQGGGVRAKVPFKFAVSGKILLAGEYTMTANAHLVKIQDAHGKPVALVLADYISGRSGGENGQIIFRCHRDSCFLAEIWSPVKGDGRKLATSRIEAVLEKQEIGKYFALLGEGPRK